MLYLRSREPVLKLVGLQATARPASTPVAVEDVCHAAGLADLHRLWLGQQPAADWTVLNQFFDELAASGAGRQVRIIYAMRDIPVPPSICLPQKLQRAELIEAITAALASRGIAFFDIESRLIADTGAPGSRALGRLRGFGLQLGQGHLNQEGHRRYAAALQVFLTQLLPAN